MNALTWPNSTGCDVEFAFKQRPEDFLVTELRDQPFNNLGQHRYLKLQKRNRTTIDVVRQLAQAAGLAESSIGYAGMKDRLAVTQQWLSIPSAAFAEIHAEIAQDSSLELLGTASHSRKLRRGELCGNRFVVVLHQAAKIADATLTRLKNQGAPNYFGSQRFGRNAQNLPQAQRWLQQRQSPRGRSRQIKSFTRGLHLSVLRAYLFNEVLAARVRQAAWSQVIAGDVCVGGDATAPLWGRGRSATAGDAATVESTALAPHLEIREGLEFAGVQQARRALVLRPQQLRWQRCDDLLTLRFDLPKGSYATSLLAELGQAESAEPMSQQLEQAS